MFAKDAEANKFDAAVCNGLIMFGAQRVYCDLAFVYRLDMFLDARRSIE